jgi:hypothetical protein
VLGLASLAELESAIERASLFDIRLALFFEPDDDLGLTAACSEPLTGAIQRVFRRFPLWRENGANASARGPPAGGIL